MELQWGNFYYWTFYIWLHTPLFRHILLHISHVWNVTKSGVWDYKKFESKNISTVTDEPKTLRNCEFAPHVAKIKLVIFWTNMSKTSIVGWPPPLAVFNRGINVQRCCKNLIKPTVLLNRIQLFPYAMLFKLISNKFGHDFR